MKRQKPLYLILILAIFFQNCASFDNSISNPKTLTKNNLADLNGKYEIMYLEFDSISKAYKTKKSIHRNFFTLTDLKSGKERIKLDNLKSYHFELNTISPKKTRITYLENGKIFQEVVVKTELKKDGYLYLKKKNLKFIGVPYLFGRFDLTKARLSLDKKKNLILDVSNLSSGAALLVVFLNSKTYKYREKLKRVE
ncbi:hypothetical protein [Aquimarina sp. MAR_2010_214]|uniref:hypothetical protein n=1 Tax=Aquimarina sp. MAR_2010_214 TaxID=1250026 RepID=UPI00117746D7|nr:hypothetical protein [Aquimarina sp. MAR_2010_214]